MEGIILFIGWVLDSMELKLSLILQQQLMDFPNPYGLYKLEMPL